MPVEVLVETTLVEQNSGTYVPGISVTCGRCDLCVEVAGDDDDETFQKAKLLLRRKCQEKGFIYVRAT